MNDRLNKILKNIGNEVGENHFGEPFTSVLHPRLSYVFIDHEFHLDVSALFIFDEEKTRILSDDELHDLVLRELIRACSKSIDIIRRKIFEMQSILPGGSR